MALPFNNFINWVKGLFGESKKDGKPRKVKAVYKNKGKIFGNAATDKEVDLSHQEKIDSILDKIKKTGYDSLTDEEKEFLFRASKKK